MFYYFLTVRRKELLLGITGGAGSGKTTLADHIGRAYKARIFEASTLIRESAITNWKEPPTNRDEYIAQFRYEQARRHNKAWLSSHVIDSPESYIVFSGLRSRYDVMNLQRAGGLVVALVCPPELAAEREASRKNITLDFDAYMESERSENSEDNYGPHLDWCIQHADTHIDTSAPFGDILRQLNDIVAQHVSSK